MNTAVALGIVGLIAAATAAIIVLPVLISAFYPDCGHRVCRWLRGEPEGGRR